MQAAIDREARLQQTIAAVYEVFARYKLPRHMEPDPCFPGFCDDTPLRAGPLQELPKAAFGYYQNKAITTWGNVRDYKHFLPRLLELATLPPEVPVDFHIVDLWLIFEKIKYAQWTTWPVEEQQVLMDFVLAWWSVTLTRPVELSEMAPITPSCVDHLEEIAHLQDDLSEFLAQWQKDLSDPVYGMGACINLAHCVKSLEIFSYQEMNNLNWADELRTQEKQVAAWVLREESLHTLEKAFHACNADSPYAPLLSYAYEVLATWLHRTG